jgi:hypothetical protein
MLHLTPPSHVTQVSWITRNWENKEACLYLPDPALETFQNYKHRGPTGKRPRCPVVQSFIWEVGVWGSGADPYPAKVRLEGLSDLLPLGIAAMCDDINDGGFIGS